MASILNRRVLIGAGVAALAATAFAVFQPMKLQGHGLEELKLLVPEGPLRSLYESVYKSYHQYRINAGRWSAVYFGSVFGSALCSAAAGVILKLESTRIPENVRKDIGATLAASAALLITLSTLGNFEMKWRANRVAASRMEGALYELAKPGADPTKILGELKAINLELNQNVVASPPAPPPSPATKGSDAGGAP